MMRALQPISLFAISTACLLLLIKSQAAGNCTDGNLLQYVGEWSTKVGASNAPGGGGTSVGVVTENGTSISLSGNDDTTKWLYYYKETDASPGDNFIFSADVNVLERTGPVGAQYNNAYIGLRILNEPLNSDDTTLVSEFVMPLEQGVAVPMIAGAGSPSVETTIAHVGVFLSMSGSLIASSLCLQKVDSFSLLVEHMDRYYSHFESSNVSWPDLTEKYRSAATEASSPSNFAEVVEAMLAELQDVHVVVGLNGKTWQPYSSPPDTLNFDPKFSAVLNKLQDPIVGGESYAIGRFADDPRLRYFLATTLLYMPVVPDSVFETALSQFKELIDSDDAPQGLIIDLRANIGGDERRAQALASLLNANPEEIVYARSKWRSGNGHNDFFETSPRVLEPRSDGDAYTRPVVVITGRACASSCEAFVMMLRILPSVIVVGTNTYGASGNPAPVHLGNGVIVAYSRWVSMLPDGISIERTGVPPDELFESDQAVTENSDPTFDFAYSILKDMVGEGAIGDGSTGHRNSIRFPIFFVLILRGLIQCNFM